MDIVVENLVQVFGEAPKQVLALDRVSHRFPSQKFTCILGPSGCGKSTLAQIIGGIEPFTSGTVTVGSDAHQKSRIALGSHSVMVWQHLNLFPWRSVIDNVAFGLEMQGVDKAERNERAKALIASVGLRGFEQHRPPQLSGGMRQRVGIARAIAVKPAILFLDEPLSALDAQTRDLLMDDLIDIWQRERTTSVYVTHNLNEAIRLADRVVVLSRRPGRIKQIVTIDVPLAERGESRHAPRLAEMHDALWQLIKNEAQVADREIQHV